VKLYEASIARVLQQCQLFSYALGRFVKGLKIEWHSRGRQFDPDQLHQKYKSIRVNRVYPAPDAFLLESIGGEVMTQKLTAVINKEDTWYVAHCIELGVVSQGKTIEEARQNLQEAVELYIESFGVEDLKLN
jgi:predicted RNase H-like HicB family nuclease